MQKHTKCSFHFNTGHLTNVKAPDQALVGSLVGGCFSFWMMTVNRKD